MSRRCLVIRGGAIGDFILTLPAMAVLKAGGATLEVMGYQRVLGLVHRRFYAENTRPIESAALAACFNPRSEVAPSLAAYLRAFDEIYSYIYDPDELFSSTLRRLGVQTIHSISPILASGSHATEQLLGPLAAAIRSPEIMQPRLYFSEDDRLQAAAILKEKVDVMVHPGSGSAAKTWPFPNWLFVIRQLQAAGYKVALCGGEVEEPDREKWEKEAACQTLWNLPLHILGACLQRARLFLGHDSGISHLASAAGVRSLLLFGPTDPNLWAPPHPHTRILQAPDGRLESLAPDLVLRQAEELL